VDWIDRQATGQCTKSQPQTSAASGSVTNVNLNDATVGQVLVASQALGLGSVSGDLETMSSDTNGSSATANVLSNSTT